MPAHGIQDARDACKDLRHPAVCEARRNQPGNLLVSRRVIAVHELKRVGVHERATVEFAIEGIEPLSQVRHGAPRAHIAPVAPGDIPAVAPGDIPAVAPGDIRPSALQRAHVAVDLADQPRELLELFLFAIHHFFRGAFHERPVRELVLCAADF